jgi:hypothetical protein
MMKSDLFPNIAALLKQVFEPFFRAGPDASGG